MQLTLFDIITEETGQNYCEICKEPCIGDLCEKEICGEIWFDLYFPKIKKNEKQDNKLDRQKLTHIGFDIWNDNFNRNNCF